MSSGFMKPLETMVGVQRISRSLRRMVMLPSLAAAKPLLYRRRPLSQMNSFSLYSFMVPLAMLRGRFAHDDPVQDTGAKSVHRRLLRVERGRRLDALAEADPAAGARPEVVVDHQV